jgi:uncharacterized SAM-binding protein YcdF (DUF218 family)
MVDYDALVVLGAAVWANETPSSSLRRRTLHAVALYQKGVAPKIIGSGGLGRFPPTEAEMIRRICVANGVPEVDVILEDASHSTLENALFSARILRQMNASRVVVVSDKYHLARAILCFRFLGFDVKGSGPDRGKTGTPLRKWLYYYLREIAAVPYYLFLLVTRKRS